MHILFMDIPLRYFVCLSADVLQYFLETIVVMPPEKFTKEQIPKYVKLVAKWFSLKTPVLMKLLRMAISGQKVRDWLHYILAVEIFLENNCPA